MTLIEIMVAMTVGLLLLAGVGMLFVEMRHSARAEQGMTEIQESGRYSLSRMARHLRMTGYAGCGAGAGKFVNTLNNADAYDWDFDTALLGYEADGQGQWNPTLPNELSNADPAPVSGSDVITVRGMTQLGDAKVSKHPGNQNAQDGPGSAALHLSESSDIDVGDVLIVMRCPDTAIFQVTNVQGSGEKLVHNTGGKVSPGNSQKELGSLMTGGSVGRVSTRSYYVAVDDDGIPGLWERDPRSGTRELMSGVESLRLEYGEDTNQDLEVESYSDAGAVGDWDDVVSVRISMLTRSHEGDITSGTGNQSLTFDGTSYGDDGRIRRVFQTTVALRNRLK